MQETWVRFLGQEDSLEEGMATHSSILAWRIPWTEDLAGYSPWSARRVRHDWAHTHTHTDIKAKPTKLHKLFVNNCNWSCKKSGCLLSKDWVWHSCTITRGDPETLRWQLPADLVLRMAGGVLEPDTVQKRSRGSQGCRNASETTSTWPPSSSMDAWTTATPFWFFFFFWHFTNVLFYFIFLWFVIFLFFIYFFYLMFGKTNTVFHFDF